MWTKTKHDIRLTDEDVKFLRGLHVEPPYGIARQITSTSELRRQFEEDFAEPELGPNELKLQAWLNARHPPRTRETDDQTSFNTVAFTIFFVIGVLWALLCKS